MKNNWEKILLELSYRTSSGIPDLRNEQHLMKLWDILKEHNWSVDARVKLLKRLDEQGKERPCPICEAQCQQGQTTAATGCISKSGGGKQTSGQEEPTDKKSKGGEEKPTDTSTDVDSVEIEPEITTKDKDLKTEVVEKTEEEFNEGELSEDGVSDEDFEKNERVKPLPNQISLEELEKSFPKPLPFPKKYLKVLQRLLNTDKRGVTISDFTDAAGGGTLESTGGEILTMMLTSIEDDNIANQLTETLLEHVKSNGNKNSIINTKWVESAQKCRQSIRDRLDREFGKGKWKIKNTAWDVKEEVETLGLSDYKKNKGFSTDMYLTVETDDGRVVLDEVSLKQSKLANLLNATTGRVQDIMIRGMGTEEQVARYDELNEELEALKELKPKPKEKIQSIQGQLEDLENEILPDGIPDDVNVKVAQERQQKAHEDNVKNNEQELNKTLLDFDKLSEEEKLEKLRESAKGLNQRDKEKFAKQQLAEMNKMIKHIKGGGSLTDYNLKTKSNQKMMANLYLLTGGKAKEGWDNIKELSHKHSRDVRDFLLSDEKAKEGLLKSIREDFPLQSLMSGEESMSLGDLSADKGTLKEIFGTDDFDEVQQNLSVRDNPPPPSIIFTAGSGEQIPIAEIKTRPDGIGYGGNWKLEMKLHKDFSAKLEALKDKGK